MADNDVAFDHRSWRRPYLLAAAVFALSVVAVGYGVASALRPLWGESRVTPGAPGTVSLDWTTHGLTWRNWQASSPAPQDLSQLNVVKPADAWNFIVFRTGRADHLSFGVGARMRFPYRYWQIPADSIGFIGGMGILGAAVLVARGHFVRGRAMEGRCVRCGYDLRATPRRCPECGWDPASLT